MRTADLQAWQVFARQCRQQEGTACMLVLQIRLADFELMKPVFHGRSILRILTIHFFELGECFGQFYSFKSKIYDNRSLFEFREGAILNVHDARAAKISVFPSSDLSRKKRIIKDLMPVFDTLSRSSPLIGSHSIIVTIKAKLTTDITV
jgi:hypothetical protein